MNNDKNSENKIKINSETDEKFEEVEIVVEEDEKETATIEINSIKTPLPTSPLTGERSKKEEKREKIEEIIENLSEEEKIIYDNKNTEINLVEEEIFLT